MVEIVLALVGLAAAVAVLALVVWFVRVARRPVRPGPARPERRSLAFTPHAQQRMHERHVDAEQIMAVVAHPDRAVAAEYLDLGSWGGPQPKESVRLERTVDGRVLKVWVPTPWPTRGEVVVKSVAWSDFEQTVKVAENAVGRVIGRGGETIRGIERETGTSITHVAGGAFRISAGDERALSRAHNAIVAAARMPAPRRR